MSSVILQMLHRRRASAAAEAELRRKQKEIIAAAKGDKGDTGPMPAHEWKGTKLRFEQSDGQWGKWVDLKGKPGDKGEDGKRVVVMGGGGYSNPLAALQPGVEGVDPANIMVMQGGQWVSLPWAAFVTTIAGAIDMGNAMSRRTDFVGETLLYRGEAEPGAAESAAVWRIRRVEFAPDGDVNETWAGGTADFIHAWEDRATLSYS